MVDLFDRGEFVAKLYADSPLPHVNMQMGINYKVEVHLSYIATKAAKAIETRDGIRNDNIKSLV